LFVETILVLEDEPFVKNPICAILRACGYRVLDAATAAEAIEVNPPHGERISLLIADVFLPDKSGVWAAVKLLDMCPTIRILFVSGTPIEGWPSQDFSALQALPPSAWRFLQKPFGASLLRDSVRELLKRRAESGYSHDLVMQGAS